jgi:hypothetical protein
MSRTSRERLVFPTVIISVVLAIFMAGMHAGRFNMARAAEASKTDVSAEGHESPEGELQQLLLERKRLLSRIVESMKFFLESGRVSIDEYRDANIALLRAEMDLCKTRDNRLKILEKIVQFHTEYEAWVERKAANGRTTRIDVEKAKIARLEAQIELARENMKGQSPEQ